MPRKKKSENVAVQPENPPPQLFLGKKEKNLVKQINDEVIERVIGQLVVYYPISREDTYYHPVYGEAIQKSFLAPIKVHCLVDWEGTATTSAVFGIDRRTSITVHFHKRRLAEDVDLYVREGDFVLYGDTFYEIVTTAEPKVIFGQVDSKMEVVAKCVKARESVFNAS